MDGVLCDGSNAGRGPRVAGMRLCDQRKVPSNPAWPQKVTLVFFILINLVVLGLSGGIWDLFQLPHAGSSSLTGLNLSPLHWEYRVLDPAPPGKSLVKSLWNEGDLSYFQSRQGAPLHLQ